MAGKGLTHAEMLQALEAYDLCNENESDAAQRLGLPRATLQYRLKTARAAGHSWPPKEPFEVQELPQEIDIDELVERRTREFARKEAAEDARNLVSVKINIDGPVGVCHFGDPHVDDPGTDFPLLRRDVELCRNTEGMFAANVGDIQNNWVGRLAHLWGEQSTSASEAWALTEWFIKQVEWLYLIGGNHDCWSGAGDPLKWIMRHKQGIFEPYGVRLGLVFPNGRVIRINARHDFAGHSMWNTAHGPAKAAQMGWRDHILTCGHKHTSGYQVLKCPSTGLISHAIRAGGYKKYDRYAKEKGLPDQNIFPAAVTIIDPQFDDDDARQVTTLFDVERACDYLTFLRRKM